MGLGQPQVINRVDERSLRERLEPRIRVEKLFAESGRTYRRSKLDIWFKRRIEPRILQFGLQARVAVSSRKRRRMSGSLTVTERT